MDEWYRENIESKITCLDNVNGYHEGYSRVMDMTLLDYLMVILGMYLMDFRMIKKFASSIMLWLNGKWYYC